MFNPGPPILFLEEEGNGLALQKYLGY